jgi:hypothetical protein
MSQQKLARAHEVLQRAHALSTRARTRAKSTEHIAVQRAGCIVAAAGLAELEQHVPPTFVKIPTKLWLAAFGYVLAVFTKGNVSRVALGASDGIAAVYAYKAAYQVRAKTANPMVAGVGEVGYITEA